MKFLDLFLFFLRLLPSRPIIGLVSCNEVAREALEEEKEVVGVGMVSPESPGKEVAEETEADRGAAEVAEEAETNEEAR